MTKRVLSRQTPDCIGAKFLIISTALRAYRNRHLGTLMRCCEAWKPVEDCFDTSSFECIDFQRLSQIIASLTRENLEAREAEVSTLPWTQTEKDTALASARVDNVPGATRNLCCLSVLLQMNRAIPWRMKINLEEDFVIIGEPFSRHARKARGITNTKTFCDLSNMLLMTSVGLLIKLNLMTSAPGLDGIPYGVYRCAGGLGSNFLFHAYKAVLEGSAIPDCFAESRTVFIPKTSDIGDLGRIIRSPDALRPLTLCSCDFKLLTSAIC